MRKQKTHTSAKKIAGRLFCSAPLAQKIPQIFLIGIIFVFAVSCGRKEVDMRYLVPKDSIIYFETGDLGKTLEAVTESEAFKRNAASAADLSAVKGMKVAIAVTGFETSENQVTQESAILNFKPKFVAVAETNAWSWQLDSLIRDTLNDFLKRVYGDDVRLETSTKNGGEWFTWTANDGRRSFAVISDTQIFFGNDEGSIENCLSAKQRKIENLSADADLNLMYERADRSLAFGFVTNKGIEKIADLAGISAAIERSEDENVRGFLSRILPQLLKNTTENITWTTRASEPGFEDRIFIKTKKDVSDIFSETIVPASDLTEEFYDLLPFETASVTRYNLKNAQIAYRSLLLVTAKNTDPASGKFISAFSNSLLEPYGIAESEEFLGAILSEIFTVQLDTEGDESLAIVRVTDASRAKKAITKAINFDGAPIDKNGAKIWSSDDGEFSATFLRDFLLIGNPKIIEKSLEAYNKRKISPVEAGKDFTKSKIFSRMRTNKNASTTYFVDQSNADKIVSVLGKAKDDLKGIEQQNIVETRFDRKGIERTYISDFGFLGVLIEQFEK